MAEASLATSIEHLLPRFARSLDVRTYNAERQTVSFSMDGVLVVVRPDTVVLNRVRDRAHAEELLARLERMLADAERQAND